MPQTVYAQGKSPNFDKALAETVRIIEGKSKKWARGLRGLPIDGYARKKEEIYKDILEFGEVLINGTTKEVYPDVSVAGIQELLNRAIPIYLGFAIRHLPIDQWCPLYKKYRVGVQAPFVNAQNQFWDVVDKLFLAQCAEKKAESKPEKPKDKAPEDKKADEQKTSDKKTGDQAGVLGECKEGAESIYVCSKKHPLRLELIGNGVNTGKIAVLATNMDTGSWGVALVDMICGSRRTMKPPPDAKVGHEEGLTYKLGKADPNHMAIVKKAYQLANENNLPKGPIHDPHELAQLTIWMNEGKKTPEKNDDVDGPFFKEKLAKQLGRQLNPEELAAAESRIDKAFEQFDFLNKESTPLIAEKPDDSKPPEKPQVPDGSKVPDPDKEPDKAEKPDGAGPPLDDESKPGQPDGTTDPDGVASTPQDCTLICIPPGTAFEPIDPKAPTQTMETIAEATMVMNSIPAFFPVGNPNQPTAEGPGELIGDEKPAPCSWRFITYISIPDLKSTRAETLKELRDLVKNPSKDKLENLSAKKSNAKLIKVFLIYECIDDYGKLHYEFRELTDKEAPSFISILKNKDAEQQMKNYAGRFRPTKSCCKA